jgi:hypothetical protein
MDVENIKRNIRIYDAIKKKLKFKIEKKIANKGEKDKEKEYWEVNMDELYTECFDTKEEAQSFFDTYQPRIESFVDSGKHLLKALIIEEIEKGE